MKALEITAPGEVKLVEREQPRPGHGEVMLRIDMVGYCGTDLSTFRGRNPLVQYPRIPGHEVAGTISEIGEGVEGWQEGEQVLVFPYTECGECSSCRANRPNCCKHNQTLGVQRDGMLSEFAAAPAKKLMRAEGLNAHELALVEPLTVGAHAATRGEVKPGEAVAVFGCGAIGLGAIAAAAKMGAQVTAIDIDDAKLALAKKCGATTTINSASMDVASTLADLTHGHGPAVVIEAVGLPITFRAAVDVVAFAGRVVYIGYAKEPVEYETKYFVMKELDIRGSRNALQRDFEFVIDMFRSGVVPTDLIVNRVASLEDAPEALRAWDAAPGEVTKVHVRLDSGS